MRQSLLFPKTKKTPPKDAQSINHRLLVQAGFIDQLMTGSWTLLPLGKLVVSKIETIIREEMNAIGAQEILMPLLHPKNIWNETGRWDSADEVMYKLVDSRKKEFALSFTHEEVLLDLARKYLSSYQDLPLTLYHFSTKFRNEARARSGILRGREFLMKDLYSLHATEKDLDDYYEKVKKAYLKIFMRIGFKPIVTEAGGGVFTSSNTHEIQVITPGGEDTIYICDRCSWSQNHEIYKPAADRCPLCHKGKVVKARGIEVGNIFRFGTYYSERMGIAFTAQNGKKYPPYFGSYGIGTSRAMGAWVEVSHDQKGIIWSESISPFAVHLIELPGAKNVQQIFNALTEKSVSVLWDDREVGAGEKFADADLIGIPFRLVVSEKTYPKIELKKRTSSKTLLLDTPSLIDYLTSK